MFRKSVKSFLALVIVFLIAFGVVGTFANTELQKEFVAPNTKSKYYTNPDNPFASGYTGQCTWYAWGRAYERTGQKPFMVVTPNGNANQSSFLGHAKYWWEDNQNLLKKGTGYISSKTTPMRDSIIVWGETSSSVYGHVGYLELYSVLDKKLYVTQSNVGGSGVYKAPEWKTIEEWNSWLGGKPLSGYIYVNTTLQNFKNYVFNLPTRENVTYDMKYDVMKYYNMYVGADQTSKNAIGDVTKLIEAMDKIKLLALEYGEDLYVATVTIPPVQKKIKSVKFNKKKYNVKIDYSKKPKLVKKINSGATKKEANAVPIKYYTKNPKIATVNSMGRVFAHTKGKVYIVAKVEGKRTVCTVNVK